jgi:dephospho-CoA kinase
LCPDGIIIVRKGYKDHHFAYHGPARAVCQPLPSGNVSVDETQRLCYTQAMLIMGLTGGIASGKSTVAQLLQGKGAHLIDFDALAHALQEPGQLVWRGIVEHFGTGILTEGEAIDRAELGKIVFGQPEKLAVLNGIVHPAVFAECSRMIAVIAAESPEAIVLCDIPLLVEVQAWERMTLDLVVLVYISPEEQVRRLINRNGFTREEALVRLASQMPIQEKIRHAHIVIDNEGTPENTRRIAAELWEDLVKREMRRRSGESM